MQWIVVVWDHHLVVDDTARGCDACPIDLVDLRCFLFWKVRRSLFPLSDMLVSERA
jgi:hypothetical protein